MSPHPHFFAYLARMKLIDRWSLMRCTSRENVQEHSLQVAIIAHALCLIKNKYFGGQVNAEKVALKAIFHDATEVLTGDLPTPVKYFNSNIREAYNVIEDHAVNQLMKLVPDDFKAEYHSLLSDGDVGTGSAGSTIEANSEMKSIIKAADTLAAYIKCVEEEAAGNHEFSRAKKTIEAKLAEFRKRAPEVDYFAKTFVPSFSLTLDELSQPLEP